jgi:hypothetical protein
LNDIPLGVPSVHHGLQRATFTVTDELQIVDPLILRIVIVTDAVCPAWAEYGTMAVKTTLNGDGGRGIDELEDTAIPL